MKKQKQDTLSLKRRNLTTSETRETKWEAWANIKEGVTTASNNHSKETRTNMKDFPKNGTKDTKKETKLVLSSNTCTQGNGWTTSFYIGSWSGVPPICVTMVGGLPGASVKKNCVKELTEEQFSHLYKQMEIIWSDMSDSWIATWCMYFFVLKQDKLDACTFAAPTSWQPDWRAVASLRGSKNSSEARKPRQSLGKWLWWPEIQRTTWPQIGSNLRHNIHVPPRYQA